MRPCIENSNFVHSRYDEAEVVTDDFLLMCSKPPRRILWLHYAVISFWEWQEYGNHNCVPLSCCVVIYFLMLVMSKNYHLTASFAMSCYFTSGILMHSMRRMLRCEKHLNFKKEGCAKRPAITHP